MSRPFFLYLCCNSPFYAILLLIVLVLLLVLAKLWHVFFGFGPDFNFLLRFVFEPVLISSIVIATVVSLVVYVLFLFELKNRDDIDDKTKKAWKAKFFRMGILANSLYYEFKYEKDDNGFFLEDFIRKSRNKMFGH